MKSTCKSDEGTKWYNQTKAYGKCPTPEPVCGCKIKLPTDCVIWDNPATEFIPIKPGDNLTTILQNIEELIQSSSVNISISNIGSGVGLYAGTPSPGIHFFKTLVGDGSTFIYEDEESVYISSSVPNHNSLSGLQGGQSGQYYHLTQAQYNALGTIPTLQQVTTAGATTNKTITISQNSGSLALWGTNNIGWMYTYSTSSTMASPTGFAAQNNATLSTGDIQLLQIDRIRGIEWRFNPIGSTGTNRIVSTAVGSGSNFIQTLQSKSGTLAHLDDITTPNLQQVTDVGATTTKNITISNNGATNQIKNGETQIDFSGGVVQTSTQSGFSFKPQTNSSINSVITFGGKNASPAHKMGIFQSETIGSTLKQHNLLFPPLTNSSPDTVEHGLQEKTGTLAHLDDIRFERTISSNISISPNTPFDVVININMTGFASAFDKFKMWDIVWKESSETDHTTIRNLRCNCILVNPMCMEYDSGDDTISLVGQCSNGFTIPSGATLVLY